jgi:RNA polymerase sigma-70 factor (ECF subfamily)
MVAIAQSILGERNLAEDAVQETFAKMCHNLRRLERKTKFAPWLAAICRNVAKDMAKAKGRTGSIEDLSDISLGAQQSQQDDFSEVREAISALPVLDREVIFLRYYDNMSYGRMSKILGISEPAVNGRLTRAKKKIAKYLRRRHFIEVKL